MRLTDCFSELIAYVAYFLKSVDRKQPPYEQVKADIQRLLSTSQEPVKKDGLSHVDYDLARFAICAWIDEAILMSSWKERGTWQREQLQRLFYQTTDAGEGFFERLNALGLQQRDVREVYYLCLAMGFKGRYGNEEDKYLLEQLKASNLKALTGTSGGLPSLDRSELFPEAYPADSETRETGKRGFRFDVSTLIFLLGPIVFFGLLFWIYRFILHNLGETFLKSLS